MSLRHCLPCTEMKNSEPCPDTTQEVWDAESNKYPATDPSSWQTRAHAPLHSDPSAPASSVPHRGLQAAVAVAKHARSSAG